MATNVMTSENGPVTQMNDHESLVGNGDDEMPVGGGSSKKELNDGESSIIMADDEDNILAKVVSKEQQIKEAFEMIEKNVPHTQKVDVVMVEEEVCYNQTRRRRLVIGLIAAAVVIALVTGISIGIINRSRSSDENDDGGNNFLNALPAPNGVWDLRTSGITSTCGDEVGWFSTVTMTVSGDGITVHTKGIKSEEFNLNGTLSMSTVKDVNNNKNGKYEIVPMLTIGPAVFFEAGGNTSFVLNWNILSNSRMHGYEIWTWSDGKDYHCYNGTATHELKRIG